jgi:hypothetical protein
LNIYRGTMKLRHILQGYVVGLILAVTPILLADESINEGIDLTLPSLGQQNWGDLFVTQFAEPISGHNHTGSGSGVQLSTDSLQNNAVDGDKIRLDNNQALRARNANDSADVDLVKLNASDEVEFGGDPTFTGTVTLDDVVVTGGEISGLTSPLAVADGGTGSATASGARTNLGLGSLSTLSTVNNGNWSGTDLSVLNGGTGASDASGARTNLGLGGLSTLSTVNNGNWSGTDLSVLNGGTGASDASGARTNLGLGALATRNTIDNSYWSGADLSVANGGTGTSSLTDHYVLLGSGTSAVTALSPSTSGYVLKSNGTGSDPSFVNPGTLEQAFTSFTNSSSFTNDQEVSIGTTSNHNLIFKTNNLNRWAISPSGALYCPGTGAQDIGAGTTATSPATIYFSEKLDNIGTTKTWGWWHRYGNNGGAGTDYLVTSLDRDSATAQSNADAINSLASYLVDLGLLN